MAFEPVKVNAPVHPFGCTCHLCEEWLERQRNDAAIAAISKYPDADLLDVMQMLFANNTCIVAADSQVPDDIAIRSHSPLTKDEALEVARIEREIHNNFELCNHGTHHADGTVSFCMWPKGHDGKHNPVG